MEKYESDPNKGKMYHELSDKEREDLDEAMAAQIYKTPISDLHDRELFTGILGVEGKKMKPEEKKLLEDFKEKTRYQDPEYN